MYFAQLVSFSRRLPALTVLLPLATVLAFGCAAPELERLEDEPPSADRFTLSQMRRTHPAIDGCQRFLVALTDRQYQLAYRQLSADTRKALTLRAQAAGWTGEDVLRMSKIPVRRSTEAEAAAGTQPETAPFDAESTFALPDVQTLQSMATAATGTSVVEQRLSVKNGKGQSRELIMRFEGLAWRIHNPELTGLSGVTAP